MCEKMNIDTYNNKIENLIKRNNTDDLDFLINFKEHFLKYIENNGGFYKLYKNNPEFVKIILKKNFYLSRKDLLGENDITLLILAAKNDDKEMMKYIIENYYSNLILHTKYNNKTAIDINDYLINLLYESNKLKKWLRYCIQYNSEGFIQILENKKYDYNKYIFDLKYKEDGINELTILHLACKYNSDLIPIIGKNKYCTEEFTGILTTKKQSCLLYAILNDISCVRKLLEIKNFDKKRNFTHYNTVTETNTLQVACNSPDILNIILESDKCDEKNFNNTNLLEYACKYAPLSVEIILQSKFVNREYLEKKINGKYYFEILKENNPEHFDKIFTFKNYSYYYLENIMLIAVKKGDFNILTKCIDNLKIDYYETCYKLLCICCYKYPDDRIIKYLINKLGNNISKIDELTINKRTYLHYLVKYNLQLLNIENIYNKEIGKILLEDEIYNDYYHLKHLKVIKMKNISFLHYLAMENPDDLLKYNIFNIIDEEILDLKDSNNIYFIDYILDLNPIILLNYKENFPENYKKHMERIKNEKKYSVRNLKCNRIMDLDNEYKKGIKNTECPICLDREKNTAFNCGHLVCYCCTMLHTFKKCPICYQKITSTIKLFI